MNLKLRQNERFDDTAAERLSSALSEGPYELDLSLCSLSRASLLLQLPKLRQLLLLGNKIEEDPIGSPIISARRVGYLAVLRDLLRIYAQCSCWELLQGCVGSIAKLWQDLQPALASSVPCLQAR